MSEAREIIKSGAFDKLADIMHKLAGPMADEIGMMVADKVKVYRVKNWINVVKKTERLLAEAHISPDAVPPRLFLPILEASSIESDETLQDLWAGLLASASKESDSLSPSFIETLKQLTPVEAKALNEFFESVPPQDSESWRQAVTFEQAATSFVLRAMKNKTLLQICDTFERLGFFRKRYGQARENEIGWRYEFTKYGIQCMNACKGPVAQTTSDPQ